MTDNIEVEESDQEQEYDVEKILDIRKEGRQWKYLVKWEGYDTSENTWEPLKHLRKEGVQELIEQFHLQNPDVPKPKNPRESMNRNKHNRYAVD
jgi:hypothetical protein